MEESGEEEGAQSSESEIEDDLKMSDSSMANKVLRFANDNLPSDDSEIESGSEEESNGG